MNYVDGYLIAVPETRRDDYRALAESAAAVFRDHGALRVVECWEDDVPEGELTSFPLALKRKEGEAVCFSWIEWPSREVRDAGLKSAMADPRMPSDMSAMPFDGKRMIFGGFRMFVER